MKIIGRKLLIIRLLRNTFLIISYTSKEYSEFITHLFEDITSWHLLSCHSQPVFGGPHNHQQVAAAPITSFIFNVQLRVSLFCLRSLPDSRSPHSIYVTDGKRNVFSLLHVSCSSDAIMYVLISMIITGTVHAL